MASFRKKGSTISYFNWFILVCLQTARVRDGCFEIREYCFGEIFIKLDKKKPPSMIIYEPVNVLSLERRLSEPHWCFDQPPKLIGAKARLEYEQGITWSDMPYLYLKELWWTLYHVFWGDETPSWGLLRPRPGKIYIFSIDTTDKPSGSYVPVHDHLCDEKGKGDAASIIRRKIHIPTEGYDRLGGEEQSSESNFCCCRQQAPQSSWREAQTGWNAFADPVGYKAWAGQNTKVAGLR